MPSMAKVVFTDLDGTLLDRDDYSWEPAQPALDRLRQDGIPWVFVTSKTRAEVEVWRERLRNDHPFIVENGGAAFIPRGYFPFSIPGAMPRGRYDIIEWGTAYRRLAAALDHAAHAAECPVEAFHKMTLEEVAARCDLPLSQAVLAQQREYDEPFLILDAGRTKELLRAIEAQGLRWTRGGRFYHVCGNNDKSEAVQALRNLFLCAAGQVMTIGLGDGWNDVPFLEVVDFPVILPSPWAAEIKSRLPHARVPASSGPAGWNEAVQDLLSR
jgi:mannosyl-3-phosphoglycerate phosphatase